MDISKISTVTWTIVFLITNLILSYLLFNIINLEPSLFSISVLTISTPVLVFAFVKTFLASTTTKPDPIVITIPPPPPSSSSSTPPSSSSKQKVN
ncbi:hypothetical protein GLOIN_2v1580817 [Rhizophagus clarus]|uniref:Uncharacterized protein n=1 Tax=Rhizophagus clarus TaxID=94130 RepID=A0A8H3QB83_9GLOM|nr:hypothetical protein GLOIN_2v1580817 [Rhizophagus clarus]